jgi:hypothetical protein
MGYWVLGIGDWGLGPIPIFLFIFNLVNGEILYNFIFEIITTN